MAIPYTFFELYTGLFFVSNTNIVEGEYDVISMKLQKGRISLNWRAWLKKFHSLLRHFISTLFLLPADPAYVSRKYY